MRIAVDAMGGDSAPSVVVEGALVAAAQFPGNQLILVGDEAQIEAELSHHGSRPPSLSITHAGQVVAMDEAPVEALRRKRDSSIARSVALVKSGEADAVVSAGNTGAVVAAATMALRTLEGVKKPGIAVPVPTKTGLPCIIIDVGANIYCKPLHLFQYGLMATEYAKAALGIENPSVGLLNIGEEDAKGNPLVRETHALFQESELNFYGNIEGREVFQGVCNVIVCEGFVGNVLLKSAEGIADAIFASLKASIRKSIWRRIAALLFRPVLRELRDLTDQATYGGAPLLGTNGICILGHGCSDAKAICNAIRVAIASGSGQVNSRIVERVTAVPTTE